MSNFDTMTTNTADARMLNVPTIPVNSPVMGMMMEAKTDSSTAAIVRETLDQHVMRWGFNPTLRFKPVDSTRCRFSVVPYAEWFAIHSFNTVHEINSMDEWERIREEIVTVSARQSEQYLARVLAGNQIGLNAPINNLPDWGFVVGFHGEDDVLKMRAISAIMMPSLIGIRTLCKERGWANPIGDACPGADDFDAEERSGCTTCWMEWLKSPQNDLYVRECVTRGFAMNMDGQHTEIAITYQELETARNLMLKGFARGIASMSKQWSNIVAEYNLRPERGGRKNVSTDEHMMRKDLHKDKPEDRDVTLVKSLARSQDGNSGGAPLADAVTQIAQTLSALQEIVAKQNSGQAASEAPPPTRNGQEMGETSEPEVVGQADYSPAKVLAKKLRRGRPAYKKK